MSECAASQPSRIRTLADERRRNWPAQRRLFESSVNARALSGVEIARRKTFDTANALFTFDEPPEPHVTSDVQRSCRLRFGLYEMDARTGEVWREGLPVHLPPQPFKVLFLLASRSGDVVTREEIRRELWGQDTFVDFDGGLNFCINQIRKALRDNADSPHFIHTLPRRGYRFIASVERIATPTLSGDDDGPGVSVRGETTMASDKKEDGGGDDEGGAPRARAGHLHEVVRERDADPRRWRAGGAGGFGRLATSPMAVQEPASRPSAPPEALEPHVEPAPAPVPSPPPLDVREKGADPRGALRRGGRGGGRATWIGLGIAGVAAAGAIAHFTMRPGRADLSYERLTFRRGSVAAARFGPHGEVAYSASWDGTPRRVYLAHPGEAVARTLELPERTIVQSVLASGDLAVLLMPAPAAEAVLAIAPTTGGTPRDVVADVSGADVSADGTRMAILRSGPEDRVELPPGHEIYRSAAKLNGLRLAPAGDRVALLEHPVPGDDRGQVVTVDAAGHRTVLSGDWASLEGLAWSPDGEEVWFTGAKVGADSTLNAVSLSGTERLVTRGPGRLILHDLRADGAALVERTTRRMELRGRFGSDAAERDLSWLDLSVVSDLSADGRRIVFGESGDGGGPGYGVFLRPTDGAPPVRLGEGRAMTLSPDGRWVLTIPLFGPPRIVALPTGAGEPRTLATGLTRQAWAGWFPDSRRIVFLAADPGQPLRAFVQDLDGGPARAVTPEVSVAPALAAPDGQRLLVRTAGPSGRWTFVPVDGGPAAPAAIGPKDKPLVFTADGSGLFVLGPWRSGPTVVERVDLATGARSPAREIMAEDGSGPAHLAALVLTPDGRSYAYSVHRMMSELYLVSGLR
jgi:DNA-binding winged helix-turn-helix (wHTH) protein